MDRKILVSIVNWNNSPATNRCLAGIAKIPREKQPDVIVVDNHSTKDPFNIEVAAKKSLRALTIAKNAENLGFAGGHNPNIRMAKERGYDFVILLNNDTEIIDPLIFDKLTSALWANPRALGAAPTILSSLDPNIIWYAGGKLSLKTSHVSHLDVGEEPDGRESGPRKTGFVTGCCLAISLERAELSKLLLPEEYFVYWEDTEWSARARSSGFQLLYVPGARLLHHVSDSLGVRSPTYIYYNIRNHVLFIRRNVKFYYRPFSLARLALIVLKYKANILLRYDKDKLRSLRAIWRGWWDGVMNVTGKTGRL